MLVSAVKHKKNMKAPIKKINAGDAIKILPRTRLRNESTSLVITDSDAICNQVLQVASVGKKSLRIVFQRDTYRMEFKSNPSVELIQTTKISENENKILRQSIFVRPRNLNELNRNFK